MPSSARAGAIALFAAALGALPAAAGVRPVIAVVKSSAVGPFEQAVKAITETLRRDPLEPEILSFDLEGDAANGERITRELRQANPRLVVSVGSLATSVVLGDASSHVPVVFSMVLYPGQSGFRSNATHAVTGVALDVPLDLQLDYVRRLLPAARRIGVLFHPAETGSIVEAARKAAPAHGLVLVSQAVEEPGAAVAALGELTERVDVVWSVADSRVFTPQTTSALILAALRRRIPLIGLSTAHVRMGALAALYCDYADVGRQTGEVVLRVLRGERPEEIPLVTPRKIELSLNLRTAQHLGLDVPAEVEREASEAVR